MYNNIMLMIDDNQCSYINSKKYNCTVRQQK